MLNIVLLTPRRRYIANRFGLGYQMPLGLVFLGGPLLDAGHRVRLVDNDVHGWDESRLVEEMRRDPPDCIVISHSGSTAAHPAAMHTAQALRLHFPEATIVYGGVYPSFAAETILREHPAVDVIVRGEGEAAIVELADCLDRRGEMRSIGGLTWRDEEEIVSNPDRPPIECLDRYRPGWELVQWDDYHLFGFGRSAGMQLSRGCPRRCTYCGQWKFWRRWRHRSPDCFVDELERLVQEHNVGIVWIADENFAADRELAREVLELIVARDLNLSLNLNMTAADVVRDRDLLPLYKKAGVDNIGLGIESLEDSVVSKIGKNNPLEISKQAVSALREHDIVCLVNVIYGLADERFASLWRTFTRLLWLDPDVVNACYLTPYFWTTLGRRVSAEDVIQPDLSRFTNRNQVLRSRLSPSLLFMGVKLTEALFHSRPRGLIRALFSSGRSGRLLRQYLAVGFRGVCAEILAFLFEIRFVQTGVKVVPGYPSLKKSTD